MVVRQIKNKKMVSFRIGNKHVYFHTILLKEPHDSNIINHFRNEFPDIFIQVLNFDIVYNYEHLFEILKISTLAERRNTMCSNKIELDFLLRIVGTNQISQAIKDGGLKIDSSIVFVLFGCGMGVVTFSLWKLQYLPGGKPPKARHLCLLPGKRKGSRCPRGRRG